MDKEIIFKMPKSCDFDDRLTLLNAINESYVGSDLYNLEMAYENDEVVVYRMKKDDE